MRQVARILGMGMSEEEVVQHILDGVSADDRLRLVFAQRPQWFTDLERLCVMTETMQMTDQASGNSRRAEPRPQTSEGAREPTFPRQAQPARNRQQTNSNSVICYNCNRPGHVARNCTRGRARPAPPMSRPCLLYTSRCV